MSYNAQPVTGSVKQYSFVNISNHLLFKDTVRARQEEGDSSGFEDTDSDYDDEEEKDNQPQPAQKGKGASKKQNLDDSFEEVVDKKKKRR